MLSNPHITSGNSRPIHCALCGSYTQAFAAQVEPLPFMGWATVPLHWPTQAVTLPVQAGSRHLCASHAERYRTRKQRVGAPYASDKRSLDKHANVRMPLLDRLVSRHPVLEIPQARQRALLYLCSPIKRRWMQLDAEDEIKTAQDGRAELLCLVLGLARARRCRKLSGLSRLHLAHGTACIEIMHRQLQRLPADDAQLVVV